MVNLFRQNEWLLVPKNDRKLAGNRQKPPKCSFRASAWHDPAQNCIFFAQNWIPHPKRRILRLPGIRQNRFLISWKPIQSRISCEYLNVASFNEGIKAFFGYDTRSLSPRKCSANILRTSSFQCIFISKSTVAPTPLFLHLIRLLKPFSKSILQCKIESEMENIRQNRYEKN